MDKPVKHLRGFTLVEVIVSLAVLSMILLALVSSMRMLADTQTRLNERVEATQKVQFISSYLTNVLMHAMPLSSQAPESEGGVLFRGEQHELMLVGPISSAAQVSGLQITRFSVDDQARLTLQFSPFPDEGVVSWENVESYPLLDDAQVDFAYRDAQDEMWVDSWPDNELRLPELIRVQVRTGGREWPDLVIRLINFQGGTE